MTAGVTQEEEEETAASLTTYQQAPRLSVRETNKGVSTEVIEKVI